MSRKRGSDSDAATEEEDPLRMALKYGMLKEEYHEVQRETRALKKRLQRARIKRGKLMEEVRFLRCRWKALKTFDLADIEETACREMLVEDASKTRGSDAEYDSSATATASEEETLPEVTVREPSSTLDSYCTPEIKEAICCNGFESFLRALKNVRFNFYEKQAPARNQSICYYFEVILSQRWFKWVYSTWTYRKAKDLLARRAILEIVID